MRLSEFSVAEVHEQIAREIPDREYECLVRDGVPRGIVYHGECAPRLAEFPP
jgi:hypothetical protein